MPDRQSHTTRDDREQTATVPAVQPNPYGRKPISCIDCHWHHELAKCPHRNGKIARLRREQREIRQQLADMTGEPS